MTQIHFHSIARYYSFLSLTQVAMGLVVEKTTDIEKWLTAHGIGFYTSGQLFLGECYALALIGKGALSTLHM